MASMRGKPISSGMVNRTVVPESDHSLGPLIPRMALLTGYNDIVQILHDSITLELRNTSDCDDKAWGVEERLPVRNGVGTDQWVLRHHRLTTDKTAQGTRVGCLLLRAVDRCETLKILLHGRREEIICGVLRSPHSVTASTARRTGEQLERGVRGWLELVSDLSHIRMITWKRVWGIYVGVPEMERGKERPLVNAVFVGVHNMDLLETGLLGNGGGGVSMQHAKVPAQRQLVVD
jgi:hypothetical protein